MATVGRRAAIAEIELIKGRSIRLTGTPAWFTWLFVHIVMLLGNRNRLATFVNLVTRYLAPSRRTNPIVGDVPVFEPRS
jgi:NADH dehydrogenase